MSETRPMALITGASSGIGEAFARALASRGHDLMLTARRTDRLAHLGAELRSAHGVRVREIVADLGTADGRSLVAGIVEAGPVDLLINNAGFGVYTPVASTAPDILEAMVQLNVLGVMQLTRAALPAMIERKAGSIINVASGLAFDPTPDHAGYSGTKAFVVNFTRAVHEEVKGSGIRMQVLIPGLIKTEFHARSGTDISQLPAGMLMDPADLAEASLRGLELGETVCIPALDNDDELATVLKLQSGLTRSLVQNGTPVGRYH
ncbi:MAG TPA: SDR family oxidoreductase [Galbitalea sp.]